MLVGCIHAISALVGFDVWGFCGCLMDWLFGFAVGCFAMLCGLIAVDSMYWWAWWLVVALASGLGVECGGFGCYACCWTIVFRVASI